MKIRKIAVGNKAEAFIEDSFSDGLNIISSDENNKGKTIITQGILYALGNKPIFPSSFSFRDYYYYLEFMHENKAFAVLRCGDTFVVKSEDGLRLFEGMSEFKRYWSSNIFNLPIIPFNGKKLIVDMELFVQLFFVAQDSKDTSNIFNYGYYHKDDFRTMLLSFAEAYTSDISTDEIRTIKSKIAQLEKKRREQLALCDFYKTVDPAAEYLSAIKDRNSFEARVSEMDEIASKISEIRKRRSRLASERSLWNATIKELKSLNRDIEVGELRCMDCNSAHIAYMGKGKTPYSFDVSTPEIRKQIIESIQARISDFSEEISKCDFDIEQLQCTLQALMDDEEVTMENIIAYKSGFENASEVEAAITAIDVQINELKNQLSEGITSTDDYRKRRKAFLDAIVARMNEIALLIDPENQTKYDDIFTKRGTVISGSEETVFYISKLLAFCELIGHDWPIIIDSFRAEDLSSAKENKILSFMLGTTNQYILTTTLKNEEAGKYKVMPGIHNIDYTPHTTGKLLSSKYVDEFSSMIRKLGVVL